MTGGGLSSLSFVPTTTEAEKKGTRRSFTRADLFRRKRRRNRGTEEDSASSETTDHADAPVAVQQCEDSSQESSSLDQQLQQPLPGPPPPKELPLRFLRAGNNDPEEGWRRYQETLQWRRDENIDNILREPNPLFDLIQRHYPHNFHLTGFHGEPVFYEQPAQTNLKALRQGGVDLHGLLRYYTQITEFQWQYLNRDDHGTSIFVVDMEGIRLSDFVGETKKFVLTAAKVSAQHYPERGGKVFLINVPIWFKAIWRVIRPIVAESTLKKIFILRGENEIRQKLQEYIPLENIPRQYGGTCVIPLGEAPEEKLLENLIAHNNLLAEQKKVVCSGCTKDVDPMDWPCRFCKWTPDRSY